MKPVHGHGGGDSCGWEVADLPFGTALAGKCARASGEKYGSVYMGQAMCFCMSTAHVPAGTAVLGRAGGGGAGALGGQLS